MGKARALTAICLLLAAMAVAPLHDSPARAQTSTPVSCSGTSTTSPMQGRYTGPWHSDGDYHFTFHELDNMDVELKIVIDGKLNVQVASDGRLSGVATGTVDAPVYD